MTAVAIGDGIVASETPVEPTEAPTPATEPEPIEVAPDQPGVPLNIVERLLETVRGDFRAAVADIERRLGQARELESSAMFATARSVHAEDLNIGIPLTDGYNLTSNSPGAGSIAWSSLHVVLLGVDYKIADGNTALKYTWFVKPASYTSGVSADVVLQASNTMPTLGPQDALIFINNAGVPISVLESSVAYAVGPGVIGNAQLDTATQTLLTNLQQSDIAMQGRIDGVITSYYQDNPPWPAGAPSPSGGDVNMGDIWYDSNDGGAFRWTGASGTPTANAWQRIADTDTSALAAKVNTKVTTYLAAVGVPPVAPTGGFTTGDIWMVTDQARPGSTFCSQTLPSRVSPAPRSARASMVETSPPEPSPRLESERASTALFCPRPPERSATPRSRPTP
jgi:hypothetical protein